jgi:predicted RNase H-like HicB family nuclease
MRSIIKAELYHDGEHYCARCLDFDIFTQGKTLDDVVENLREAVRTHFEEDPESLAEFSTTPSLLTMLDLGEIRV